MKKDEEAVQGAMKALQEWNSNPWDPDITALRSLESKQLASKQLEKDFNTSKELEELQINQIFQERVLSDEKKIYDRIALNKRKNFSKPPQENTVDKPRKTDRMENRAMVKILSLAEGSKVDLEDLMSYRLTEVCLPIFNINGLMRRAVKAKLVDCFLVDETNLDDVAYISIIDMGYLWRLAAPTASDREKKDKFTWGNYVEKIFNMIIQ